MQLILNSETDITIQRKMAAIKQEAFDEKFMDELTDELDKEIANIKKEYVEKNIAVIANDLNDMETDNTTINDHKLSEVNLNKKSINNTDQNEPNNDTVTSSNECNKAIKAIVEFAEKNQSESIDSIADDVVENLQSKEDETEFVAISVKTQEYVDKKNESETIESIADDVENYKQQKEVKNLQSKEDENECVEIIVDNQEYVHEKNESETIESIADDAEKHNNEEKVKNFQSKEDETECVEISVEKQEYDDEKSKLETKKSIADDVENRNIDEEVKNLQFKEDETECVEISVEKREYVDEKSKLETKKSIADDVENRNIDEKVKNLQFKEDETECVEISVEKREYVDEKSKLETKESIADDVEHHNNDEKVKNLQLKEDETDCVEISVEKREYVDDKSKSETKESIADYVENHNNDEVAKNLHSKEDETECVEISDEKQDGNNDVVNNIQEIVTNNEDRIRETFEIKPNETITESIKTYEVIDIADDINEECVIDEEIFEIEENTLKTKLLNTENIPETQSLDTENANDTQSLDTENTLDTQSLDAENTTSVMQSTTNLTGIQNIDLELNEKEPNANLESLSAEIISKKNLVLQDQDSVHEQEITNSDPVNDVNKDSEKFSLGCKLSNTLDILCDNEEEHLKESSKELSSIEEPSKEKSPREGPLREKSSDEELSNQEPPKEESQKEDLSCVEEKCINAEDDDVIMVIDEEPNAKDDKNNLENNTEEFDCQMIQQTEKPTVEKEIVLEPSKDEAITDESIISQEKQEDEKAQNQLVDKPLLPVNFLKTCKKNLTDMTREELEEFCILKIVESVVDRSNLTEIKSQLNNMSQNVEEYKKKAFLIQKQNRDLQVVLKSVQEEQKKSTQEIVPITPLKITRSVGMQVFMTDKTVARKKTLGPNNQQNNQIGNSPPNRQSKTQTPKTQKAQINTNNTNQIPVPRLVPAVNNSINSKQPSVTNSSAKTPITPTTPNGIRNSPPIRAEKRPHSRMQQVNSVTVDLTDDEPPTKILQRNMNPPVRLVPSQNLLAPQRQPFVSTISSPRKVYIPISGSQNQVRPGQAIMLKSVTPSGPRPRVPSILGKTNLSISRMPRLTPRHPAPLPDSIKQYQPPNWKALPPAPEVKLSNVEHGIVISWKIDDYNADVHEEIASYQLYAYQEICPTANSSVWKKIGDVKALPLPMACTLTQFMSGYKYHFAVRAIDIRSRLGPFSNPGNILLSK